MRQQSIYRLELDRLAVESNIKYLEICFTVKITIPLDDRHSISTSRDFDDYIEIDKAFDQKYIHDYVKTNSKISSHPLACYSISNIYLKETTNSVAEKIDPKKIKIMNDFSCSNAGR